MLQHSFIIAVRNFWRYKSSFIINLTGLSIGLTSAFLIYVWAYDELAIDRFHENDVRLYQVMRNVSAGTNDIETFDNNSDFLAPALKQEFPEVEYVVPVSETIYDVLVVTNDKTLKVNGQFAGKDFFKVFSFPILAGDEDHVLEDKHSIVISNEIAINLFGSVHNATGKSIALNEEEFGDTYVVSGVFEKIEASSEVFDFVASNEMFLEMNGMDQHWDSNTVHTYVLLHEEVSPIRFNAAIRDFVKNKFKAQYGTKNLQFVGTLFVRPYSDKYLFNHFENGVSVGGRIDYVYLFVGIGLFILIIASINFINLSTARATRRSKEVGVKKAVGADRTALITQFMLEALTLACCAMFLAISLAYALLPEFNQITGKHLSIDWSRHTVFGILVITIFTGLLSGFYPALYLARLKPISVLKGKMMNVWGEVAVRKGLVIFQFCASVLLIISVLIIYRQINFVQTKSLGYEKDNILTFKIQGSLTERIATFIQEIEMIPGVVNASSLEGDVVKNHGEGASLRWDGQTDRVAFATLWVNYGLIETLGVDVVEGRSFSPEFGSDSSAIILNETAVKIMGIENPVGKTMKLWGKDVTVVGVVADFHFESMYEKVKPFFFALSKQSENFVIKIKKGDEQATLFQIEKLYNKLNPGVPFEFNFVDDSYNQLYRSEQRISRLALYSAIMAIVISCLGLYGIVSFAAERRIKEIGIRKILGATQFAIVNLLTLDFLKLILLSIGIALPIGYFLSEEWLTKFAYRVELEWWYFVSAGFVALVISLITIATEAFKAAASNPIKHLQSE